MAASKQNNGDLNGAEESYKHAMSYTPDNTLDWAIYAFQLAVIHIIRGEQQLALHLLQKALHIRNQLEKNSQEIDQIQRAIDNIHQQTP
jgi:tetratricopeptide (TPR) repeat protein